MARAAELEKLNANLIATKKKATARAQTDRGLGVIANAPRSPGPINVPPGPPPVQANPPAAPAAPRERELTAAERLALKRRERK